MAAVEKFSTTAICNILRHNNRQIANPSNKDIDPLQSQKNYSLLNQPESSYDLFLSRKKDLYCQIQWRACCHEKGCNNKRGFH